jgi:hypothetical protein
MFKADMTQVFYVGRMHSEQHSMGMKSSLAVRQSYFAESAIYKSCNAPLTDLIR